MIRIIVFLGLYRGPRILGSYHIISGGCPRILGSYHIISGGCQADPSRVALGTGTLQETTAFDNLSDGLRARGMPLDRHSSKESCQEAQPSCRVKGLGLEA